MKKDYVPDSVQNIHTWADNLFDEIALQAAALGWDAAQVTAFQAQVAPIRDAASEVMQKQDDLDTAAGNLRASMEADLPALRKSIAAIKTTAGYNQGIGEALAIVTTGSDNIDPSTYKPDLKAAVFPGYVRLTGTKRGADSLNLYTRLQGQTTWALLAAKRVRFPYEDDAPLHTPGAPEVREYRAIGVEADSEIGQPSDIVTATFAG